MISSWHGRHNVMARGMQAMWSGTISFSLVTIPIKLYRATAEQGLHFHFMHSGCGGRVRYTKVCVRCEAQLDEQDITRGYDAGGEDLLELTDDEMETMAPDHGIEIEEFVKLTDIDPIAYHDTYFVEPQAGAAKSYALLYRALVDTGLVGVARMVMRTKAHLVTLRPVAGCIILTTMLWPDEIRSPVSLTGLANGPDVAVAPAELRLAINLVKVLTPKRFDYSRFRDTHREELAASLQERAKALAAGKKPKAPVATKTASQQGVDILTLLRESVQSHVRTHGAAPATAPKVGRTRKRQEKVDA